MKDQFWISLRLLAYTAMLLVMQSSMVPSKDWVVCRIFRKRRATRIDAEIAPHYNYSRIQNNNIELIDPGPSLSSSSSSSSCVTNLSEDGEEGSSDGIASSPNGREMQNGFLFFQCITTFVSEQSNWNSLQAELWHLQPMQSLIIALLLTVNLLFKKTKILPNSLREIRAAGLIGTQSRPASNLSQCKFRAIL